MMPMPYNPSDSGPEDGKPRDWYEWLDEADSLVGMAKRCYRDLISNERAERRNLIEQAKAALDEAMELM